MHSKDLFHNAKWVSTPCDTPVLQSEFTLSFLPQHADLTICGLGFFECYINGQKISPEKFGMLRTEYHNRFLHYKDTQFLNGEPFSEELGHRIHCPRYDVAAFLRQGKNTLQIWLAPGWYGHEDTYMKRYGSCKACFLLSASNGSDSTEIVSDESMTWKTHFITESSVYGRETQDFTIPEDSWKPVTICDAPDSEFFLRDCPADAVIRHTQAALIKEENGVRIYDAGENSTGYPILRSKSAGTIVMEFAEECNETLDLHPTHNYGQKLTYVTDDTPRILYPHFTWIGYRYFSVIGDADVIDCAIVHCDVDVTSSFTCSSDTINWIYDAYKRTQLSNMHCGIPSDCPHIERLGYTGDGQLMCDTVMHTLDAQKFYRKWIDDISDCQDRTSGHVQYTAPYTLAGGGPGGWGCAIVTVPYRYYQHYGDTQVLSDNFNGMLRYFEYLEAHSEKDIVVSDQPGLWCLGEWCTPTDIAIPTGYVNNYFYVLSMELVVKIAEIIGRTDVVPMLKERIETKKAAIMRDFYDTSTGNFCENIQMANCFALDIGMGDARTWNNLCADAESLGCYGTGIFGTEIITRLFFDRGRADLGYMLLSSEGPYSFHHWKEQNATTFYEYWGEARSHSHPMFGAVVTDLFRSILGIRQEENSTRFTNIVIAPAVIDALHYAEGHITTARGKIAVRYTRTGQTYDLRIEIPEATHAVLKLGNTEKKLTAGVNICSISI